MIFSLSLSLFILVSSSAVNKYMNVSCLAHLLYLVNRSHYNVMMANFSNHNKYYGRCMRLPFFSLFVTICCAYTNTFMCDIAYKYDVSTHLKYCLHG